MDEFDERSAVSGVGGVFRDPYGRVIADDAPVGWWRLDELLPKGVSSRSLPCVSCSTPTADRSRTAATVAQRCHVYEPSCVASVADTRVALIQGVPNSEALQHGTDSSFGPYMGEGMSAAFAGSSGPATGIRLMGQGGIAIPYADRLLHHSSFTFELWLRLAGTKGMYEQTVASCGSIETCGSGGSDPTCQSTPVRAMTGRRYAMYAQLYIAGIERTLHTCA